MADRGGGRAPLPAARGRRLSAAAALILVTACAGPAAVPTPAPAPEPYGHAAPAASPPADGAPAATIPAGWHAWWERVRRGWSDSGSRTPCALTDPRVLSDADVARSGGISLRRPNAGWIAWTSGDGLPHCTYVALDEGRRAAWIEVRFHGIEGKAGRTPALQAASVRERTERRFRDLRVAIWDRPCTVGGHPGIEQVLEGTHRDHEDVVMHNVFVEADGVLYSLLGTLRKGGRAGLEREFEEILGSARITR